jgi:hypothetical protein
MNDLKILRDAWGTPDAPSDTAFAQARAALLARATRGAPSGRPSAGRRVRLAAVGAFAVAIAIGLVVMENLGGDERSTSVVPGLPGVPVASAEVLERAADAAETKPFTAPRDDQWIYIEDRFTGSRGGEPVIRGEWHRADGGGFAYVNEKGELQVEAGEAPRKRPGRPAPGPFDSYKALAALPTASEALLRWAYQETEHTSGCGRDEHAEVYCILNHLLRGNVVPPDLEAAIFRAMKQIPGVTVETVDVLGRPALALGLETADWLREELLLDPASYAYLGERSTVVRDAVIDPLKAGNSTGEVEKGSQVIVERLATAIVDEPGERRRSALSGLPRQIP